MRRKCEVETAPADSAKLITSQGFLRGIARLRFTAAALLPRAPVGESLRPTGLWRPAIARCDNATPGNSACFGCADAEAGTHVRASSEGGRPTRASRRNLRAPILTISIRPRNFS